MRNNIRTLRKRLELTQDELAKFLGVTRQTINCIENNKYNPTFELAMKLSSILGVQLEQVFFWMNEVLYLLNIHESSRMKNMPMQN